jgi:hypothetical protein
MAGLRVRRGLKAPPYRLRIAAVGQGLEALPIFV